MHQVDGAGDEMLRVLPMHKVGGGGYVKLSIVWAKGDCELIMPFTSIPGRRLQAHDQPVDNPACQPIARAQTYRLLHLAQSVRSLHQPRERDWAPGIAVLL